MRNIAKIQRAMMGVSGDKPVFVDWIKGDGVAYIQTSIYLYRGATVKCDVEYQNQGGFIFGARNPSSNGCFFGIRIGGNYEELNYFSSSKYSSIIENYGSRLSLWYGYVATTKMRQRVNGVDIVASDNASPVDTQALLEKPLIIFGVNVSGSDDINPNRSNAKIYSFQIQDYNSDEYIHNFRPCFYKGEYGLWDVINNKFYGNASGQGAFTGGYDE